MTTVTNYLVVTANSPNELTEMVNNMIAQGWQPFGGAAITLTGPRQEGVLTVQGTILAQALVR